MGWRRWILGSIFLAALLAASWLLWVLHLVNSVERDYILASFVLQLVEDYVTEHGEWPKAWHDLEQVKRAESWDWPKASRTIQRRIVVDFNPNLNELASQSVDQFQAVRPIHPNVLFNDNNLRRAPVESLLKAVRRVTEDNKRKEDRALRETGSLIDGEAR